ncbi:P-loop containing nucleoside triphosphate hydrolase protein [Aspergillus avenaceus]|uniref:P-loop containing nucleoside triphosphate hydrolase protein n=1 Tax=Aspergillus avenaceus TaxID=36643 RepID=A0A5N6U7H8_ASPAV|nr:P-loop containing nucleoside triphosphate hydrolase protein [Aspergillus avenaceus]
MLVGAIAVTVVATTTSLRHQFIGGSVGVALNMVLTFSQLQLGHFSQVESFVQETPSEDRAVSASQLQPGWPSKGVIELEKVTVQFVINLSIRQGEKMVNTKHGIIKIDGEDLGTMQPQDIISCVNVMPQELFILPESIRFNLDPRQLTSETTIENALRAVGLWDRIMGMGGLDMRVSVSSWSLGELQLLCLARAMVKQSSILILDEAISRRCYANIIDQHFTTQTVVAVVHRLAYVHRFDRVLVLNGGRILEWDTPQSLLAKDSELRRLYNSYH